MVKLSYGESLLEENKIACKTARSFNRSKFTQDRVERKSKEYEKKKKKTNDDIENWFM